GAEGGDGGGGGVGGRGVRGQRTRTAGLVGTLFLPPGDGRYPTVIVVSGGGGAIEEFRAAVLASHGYAGLALAYFAQPGLPRGLVNIPLEARSLGCARSLGSVTACLQCPVCRAAGTSRCCWARPLRRSAR